MGPVWRPKYPFQHALFHEPEVRSLTSRHSWLKRIGGRSLWRQQLKLMQRLRCDIFPTRASTAELKRLDLWTICRTNTHWFCTHFAYLYVLFAVAKGWTARILNIGRDNPQDTHGHMVCEVWNDELQKWIVVDPLYAAWFSCRAKPDEPLSYMEIRADWLVHRGRNVRAHFCVEDWRKNIFCSERSIPAVEHNGGERELHPDMYFWGVAYLTNRFLTDAYADRHHLVLMWRDSWNDGRLWLHQNKPVSYHLERRLVTTGHPMDFHPPLNNVAIWIRCSAKAAIVHLKTLTPNFSHFEMKRMGQWRRIPAEFVLPRKKGRFCWQFCSVNQFGGAGKRSVLKGTSFS